MKIVKPGCAEIKIADPLKKIEVCGRLCYKSEENITDGSDVKFVKMLRDRSHTAMLEHAQYHIILPHVHAVRFYNLPLEAPVVTQTLIKDDLSEKESIITGNVVTLRKLINAIKRHTDNPHFYLAMIVRPIWAEDEKTFEVLFGDLVKIEDTQETSNSHCVTDDYILKHMSATVAIRHVHLTYKFICDRGVSHELVRHRPVSFAQESTRYCNYSQAKYSGEITFIEPYFFVGKGLDMWKHAMINAETSYMEMLQAGASAQEARSVLPNSIKTEIIMTAPITEWHHIFNLRTAPAAHPQMIEVMKICESSYLSTYEKSTYNLA